MAIPSEVDITRTRGDTVPVKITVRSGGTAVDVTGMTFALAVDSNPEPVDETTQLFTVAGTIVGDPTDGRVNFAISADDADQTPAEYYYDIQRVTGGLLDTIAKGKYTIAQDINKDAS